MLFYGGPKIPEFVEPVFPVWFDYVVPLFDWVLLVVGFVVFPELEPVLFEVGAVFPVFPDGVVFPVCPPFELLLVDPPVVLVPDEPFVLPVEVFVVGFVLPPV